MAEEDNTEEAPQKEEATTSEEESTARPDSEDYAEDEDAEEAPQEEAATAPKDDEFERLKNKVSELEKERNQYQTAAQMVQALNEAAKGDPEFMLAANQKLLDQGVISQDQFEKIRAQVKPSKKSEKSEEIEAPAISPEIEWARKKREEELASEERFIEEFEANKSDLTDGTLEQVKSRRAAIGAAAALNMDGGMDKREAFELAYKQILHPEKLSEEGELKGLAKARSSTPAVGSASGTSAKSSSSPQLSEEELDAAKRLGISPDDYAAAKDPNYGVEE